MSLTSYRAAPPRDIPVFQEVGFPLLRSLSVLADFVPRRLFHIAFSRPGSDLLSRVLRRSTIGAGAFHGRVRNGNGCGHPAMTTRSAKGNVHAEGMNIVPFLLWQTFPVRSSLTGVPKRPYGNVCACFVHVLRSW